MPTTASDLKTTLMVGMEIHVELATRSKMWTSAPNVAHRDYFDAEPNTLLDPVVIGMPGVLPVMNRQAVEMAIRVGLALGCQMPRRCKWDRKSYYYPDLPKNYQISQYDQPICGTGSIDIPAASGPATTNAPMKTIGIIRAHLEEDAGKLLHAAPGGTPIDHSIVDLNRAGTPLLEIVTEPDIQTPQQAVIFGQILRNLCRHLGVTEGIMQRGHMRFEPNINIIIEKDGRTFLTPIVEIKNLNSFKALHGAIAYEYERQVEEWQDTGRVMGERAKSTRGWDDVRCITTHQRHKEDADEYRYFPDPDLVELVIDEAWLGDIDKTIPELPLAKQQRYVADYGLTLKQAEALIDEPEVCKFYEAVLATGLHPRQGATILLNYGQKQANERGLRIDQLGITPQQICDIAALAQADTISSSGADQLFGHCCDSANHVRSAQELAQVHGLLQVSDTIALEGFVDKVIADPKMAKAVEDVRAGKDKAIGAIIGQVMKLSKGQANPKLVGDLIRTKLQNNTA